MLKNLDREKLRQQFKSAKPVPYFVIDNFLEPETARGIMLSYPSFDMAQTQGHEFKTVNERKKIQIIDATKFPAPVAALNDFLASPAFLADLSYITGMPNLLADAQLLGGGIHMTGPGGRLDVHVDFNYIKDRQLHRRLNLLLYLNEPWKKEWGGQFELWDERVEHCETAFDPLFNRCVVFETNDVSFHGVIPVTPEAPVPRKSFAAYYYTKEAPAHWKGEHHGTIFKARPEEKMKGMVLMPAERVKDSINAGIKVAKQGVKKLLGRKS